MPALLCVVNAVSCAGKILRKNATTGTSANALRITLLTAVRVQDAHATQTSASSPSSDQKLLPRSVLRADHVAVSATIAYGVSRMT